MANDVEDFASRIVIGTAILIAITVLARGTRLFEITQWPRLVRIYFCIVIVIQNVWGFWVLFWFGPHNALPAWIGLLFAIGFWPRIIHVWRKRLPTDMPLFHVPPVGTPGHGQQKRTEEKM